MKSRPLYVSLGMAVMSALVITATPTWATTEAAGRCLDGKMFTLSRSGGGITFYAPSSAPTSSPGPTRPYDTTTWRPYYPTHKPTTTRRPYYPTHKPTILPYTTRYPYYPPHKPTTRPHHKTTTPRPWTTAPATRGVSVCLRYLADDLSSTVVTLSPSSRAPLRLGFSNGWYTLTFDPYGYSALSFRPSFRFWSNMVPDIWTRVCVTLDSMKNVAQVFSGSNISIRKMMPSKYDWSGEPVINFSGFDGQLTDVQIWDYPLRYKEVFNYMTSGIYAPYRGSALSWSNISYSSTGGALLEESYEWQARRPIGGSGEKTWAVSNMESQNELF